MNLREFSSWSLSFPLLRAAIFIGLSLTSDARFILILGPKSFKANQFPLVWKLQAPQHLAHSLSESLRPRGPLIGFCHLIHEACAVDVKLLLCVIFTAQRHINKGYLPPFPNFRWLTTSTGIRSLFFAAIQVENVAR